MGVDMTTLLHQGLQKDKPNSSDALVAARAQVLASARGGSSDDAPTAPEAAPETAQDASVASAGPEQALPVEEGPAQQATDAPSGAQEPGEDGNMPLADEEPVDDAGDADAEAPDAPEGDDVEDAADEREGAQLGERPCETPIEVAGEVLAESADMDTQAEMGGTDRTVAGAQAAKAASPPRRVKEPIATNVKAPAGGADKRQVRGVAESTLNIVRAAFPSMSYGDAINAYVAWKSGDLSGLSKADAELVQRKAKEEADPLVRVNNTLTALEKKMDKQASAIGELEVYTVFVMLDRLGFRPAGTMSTVSDVDLNVIKDVPTVMPRLSRQAEEIRRKVEQKKGRPQRNASLPSQEVV